MKLVGLDVQARACEPLRHVVAVLGSAGEGIVGGGFLLGDPGGVIRLARSPALAAAQVSLLGVINRRDAVTGDWLGEPAAIR